MNIFEEPTKYLNEILSKVKIVEPQTMGGLSMAVVFFTKICPVGCNFCFFKSPNKVADDIIQKQEFTDELFEKFINFVNSSNIGLLEISGGGEPFEKPNYILRTIDEAKVKKIVIVTSGYWANNIDKTEFFLKELESRIAKRTEDIEVVLRVSVDKSHANNIGIDKIKNIINVFENNFINDSKFRLQIHTMREDSTVEMLMNEIGASRKEYKQDNGLFKNKDRYLLITQKEFPIQVESAKVFASNLKARMHNLTNDSLANKIFKEDLDDSQNGSFSLYRNFSGDVGLDYLVNYNGNITTWGNYQRYNCPNLYIHSREEIKDLIYKDVISYSFLTKSFSEINKEIRAVNEKAADRSILINVRDFSGSYLLEEDHTALYYAIILVKEYLDRGIVEENQLNGLCRELKRSISLPITEIRREYNDSSFDIFKQLKQEAFSKEKWDDVFELVKLGHYEVTEEGFGEALEYYKKSTGGQVPPKEFPALNSEQQARLLAKLCPMNSNAEKLFKEKPENSHNS